MSSSGICMLPLEANPEVLTNFGRKLGLNEQLVFADVYGTEEWALAMLPGRPLAYLLVYTLSKSMDEGIRASAGPDEAGKVWFMKQTVGNACGTVAVLHAVGNTRLQYPPKVDSYLDKYFSKCADVEPMGRGKMLESDNDILEAHRSSETEGQSNVPSVEEKIQEHFIALVEQEGRVYELDGRLKGPVDHGSSDSNFACRGLEIARREFMDKNADDIRFSLLALCDSSQAATTATAV